MGLLLLQGASDLNPRELFANNEQGLWLDPSQMSTLYQDSNGVTPCTAAGDPVGLILDQSRGGLGALGSELVTNGEFATDTNWTKDAGWTIAGGVAVATNAGTLTSVRQNITTVSGRMYKLEFTCASITSGLFSWRVSGSVYGALTSSTGKTSIIFSATSSSTEVAIIQRPAAAPNDVLNATFDNISVREVPGNHAYQTTSGARPTLARIPSCGRRNLLLWTEQFDVTSGGWNPSQASVSANATTAPDGTLTADKLNANTSNSFHGLDSNFAVAVVSGSTYTLSVYAKSGEYSFLRLGLTSSVFGSVSCYFDLANGTVGTRNGGVSAAIANAGSGWYRCSFTVTATGSGNANQSWIYVSQSDNQTGYVGSATSGIFIWGAQLETGSSATNYQKVVATTDVTESGFNDLWHLVFDGSDDSLTTNSVDMTGTAQMTVIAGVRKLSDGAFGVVCELTTNAYTTAGGFWMFSGGGASGVGNYWGGALNGSSGYAADFGTYTAPITNVVSLSMDTTQSVGADELTARVNGLVPTRSNTAGTSAGNGNFANSAIYIGRRSGSAYPFNGHLYQLIVRGKTTPTGKLLEAERFTARKTGVTGI